MLRLLPVSIILYLISMPGDGWAEKLPIKMRNDFVVASFLLVG